jgi:hypothetical protein
MAWITGVAGSLLGVALSCLVTLWAAKTWPSFDNRLLIVAGLLPLFGFIAGFAPVAKMQGDWPLSSQAPRVLLGFAAAVLSAVGMYLSFVMVSWTWNEGTLPPEKRSLVYLMLHPSEVPPLTVQTTNRGGGDGRTRDETWHVLTIIVFFVAGFAGYMWSGRGGG